METGYFSHAELVSLHGSACKIANRMALVWRDAVMVVGCCYNGDLVEFANGIKYVYSTKGFSLTY